MKIGRKLFLLLFISFSFLFINCTSESVNIKGFSEQTNQQLEEFLISIEKEDGRKVAVFDGDGTVLGQSPHYLADECLFMYAKENPGLKEEIINEMKGQSNVSLPYVQNRVKFLAGLTLEQLRDLGDENFKKYYSNKIFEPMRGLINLLKEKDFEIWIVTASPEAMYQKFLSRELGIPITNIIGVKSVIKNGVITDRIVEPVPQDEGKMEAIETFIQEVPLIVGGNSRGDREMIELSRGLKIVVNPDEHIAAGDTESMADYAKRNNWLIVRVNDTPNQDFPSISSKEYGIRLNKTNKVD